MKLSIAITLLFSLLPLSVSAALAPHSSTYTTCGCNNVTSHESSPNANWLADNSPGLPPTAPHRTITGQTNSTTLQAGTKSTTLQTGTQSTTLQTGTQSTTLQTGTQSTTLQTGTQSTTLQTGTQSTTLQTGTQSTTLQTGTQSTTLQTGTQSTLLHTGTQGTMLQTKVEQQAGPLDILILIDSSYSMKERLSGAAEKMETAKQVLQDALQEIPPDINLGLRVFGQSMANDPYIDCQQSALLVPFGQGNRRSIIERVRGLHPFGLTPLTYALMQSKRDFEAAPPGQKTIILISDGAETCGGNPCTYIQALQQMGIFIKVDIIGLGLKHDRQARSQLNCIAQASGGKYYDANNAQELIDSLSQSVKTAIEGRVILNPSQKAINPLTPSEP